MVTLATLAVTAVLTCQPTLFWNTSKFPWNKHDEKIYKLNKPRCGKGKYESTPCTKYFRKTGERDYHWVCSTVRDSHWGK